MKTTLYSKNFTKESQENFINQTNHELACEIWESQMIAEELTFDEYYKLYQAKHLEKYGYYLMPLHSIHIGEQKEE